MSIVRGLLAAALLVLAALLGAGGIIGTWLHDNVVDEDGFMAIAGTVGSDARVQERITDTAIDQVLDGVGLPALVRDPLEPWLQERAGALTATDLYQRGWEGVVRRLHQQVFQSSTTELELDLEPVATLLHDTVEDRVGLTLPLPEDPSIPLGTIERTAVLDYANQLDPWAGRAGWAALGCAVLALVVAPRRAYATIGVGAALLAAAGLIAWALAAVPGLIPDAIGRNPFVQPVVAAFDARARGDLGAWVTGLAAAGGAAVLAGIAWAAAAAVTAARREDRAPARPERASRREDA